MVVSSISGRIVAGGLAECRDPSWGVLGFADDCTVSRMMALWADWIGWFRLHADKLVRAT